MSFPDTEDRAREIEAAFPLAAARLRQYSALCKTFEAQIDELRVGNSALFSELVTVHKDRDNLTTERDALKQQVSRPADPSTPPVDLAALEARITELEAKLK